MIKLKDDEMGTTQTRSTLHTKRLSENCKRRGHLGNPGIAEVKIIKWVLNSGLERTENKTVGFYEYGNGPLGSMNAGNFLTSLVTISF
jgi:hypothetical protein